MTFNETSSILGTFPPQQLPFRKKGRKWREACVDYGDNHSLLRNSHTQKSVAAMTLNYDLLFGKLHMEDLKLVLNPYGIESSTIPDNIQHYAIINSKLRVLEGEESRRLFDYRAVVTNPNAISEIEEEKNKQVNARLQQLLMDTSQSEEEFQQELEKISDYFQFEYQDKREVRANRLINHYVKELELPQLFNKGFEDAYTVGEELYLCDIVGGEPTVEKLNPKKVRIIRSGTSTNIEDADMIVIEDYWSPGQIVSAYYDQLSKEDIDALEEGSFGKGRNRYADSLGTPNSVYGNPLIPIPDNWEAGDRIITADQLFDEVDDSDYLPYDAEGNIRVLRVFWKSRKKIRKVKSYDPETGEEQFDFFPENYHIDPDKGEEEKCYWINEAWEGTKIGEDIYVNMRPRPIQYNRLSNPSRCHFGIIGSIYSSNGEKPFSLVDIMKPYAYLYDVTMDKLNKLMARNLGKIVRMDFAKTPRDWEPDEWLYYMKVLGLATEDSFKEATIGAATGKIAGALNNANNGVIDASMGAEIQFHINLAEWIDSQAGKLAGITDQRLGQISNRETVGGVERATLQSSHSTEWLFFTHESVKRRVLECLLETSKIALKGRKEKFYYILSDGSRELVEIDGDEFAECDYGIIVDNSQGIQELNQKMEMLVQAAIQNGMPFSVAMKMYGSMSLAEKQRLVERDEQRRMEQQMQQQQQQMQVKQQEIQAKLFAEKERLEREYLMHQEDNETKILVAQINSKAEADRLALMNHDNAEANAFTQQELDEKVRQFDAKMKQEAAKLELDKQKHKDDVRLKEKQIAKSNVSKK